MSKSVRLQKYIADSGLTSRRKAEDMILQGRVEINGEVCRVLGTKVSFVDDVVMADGQLVDPSNVEKIYLLFNKPRGVMTTLSDPEGRKTVVDFIQDVPERVYPVGRLDYLSEGLLLLTNDGDMAQRIIHPSKNITKVYEVKIFGAVSESILKKLREGINTEIGHLKPKSVRVIKQLPTKTWLEFRLTDGKNREIRRICEDSGLTIDKLKRIAIGGLSLSGVSQGSYTYITKKKLDKALEDNEPAEFWSGKKTINLSDKGAQDCTLANDSSFLKFRKGDYFKTLKELNERKALEAKEKRTKEWEEKEAAHQKRKARKNNKKSSFHKDRKSVHAKIV